MKKIYKGERIKKNVGISIFIIVVADNGTNYIVKK